MRYSYFDSMRFDSDCPAAFAIRGVAEKNRPAHGEWLLDMVTVDPENPNRYTAEFSHSMDHTCYFKFIYTVLPDHDPNYSLDILKKNEPQEP